AMPQSGALSWLEPGEFYKIHLQSGQRISVFGEASGPRYPNYTHGSNFTITLYNAALTQVALLTNIIAPPDATAVFPAARTNPPTYTNTGAEGDFYLKVRSQTEYTHAFTFTVRDQP